MAKKSVELVNRELSWLSFNARVLQEAEDLAVPLIERLRFLGIYSNNRDEFFRVRVATVKRLVRITKKLELLQGKIPAELLASIQSTIIKQQKKFDSIYNQLLKELEAQNIFILNYQQLSPVQGKFVRDYFDAEVRPVIFPIIIENTHQFPYLRDKSIYLLVKMYNKSGDKSSKHALIDIPTQRISRFLILPSEKEKKSIILLEDVIRYNLDSIFAIFEFTQFESYIIKITRDAELDLEKDLSKSLLEKISRSLKKRKRGLPVRLAYDDSIPDDLIKIFAGRMKFGKNDNLIPGGRTHNFKDFINFPDIGSQHLRYKKLQPLHHPAFTGHESSFPVILNRDVLLFFPYHSYNHILNFLQEASIDPKVESIRITLYRMATNSIVVNALINALKNGKSVTVVVELQARFDEEANIFWANQLQDEGATVIYGVPGLKVHSKLFLITRRESGKLVRYAHVGTGNFNEETARIYSDISLLTADKRITDEVVKLFTFYSNNFKTGSYKHLLVAPWFMRKKYIQLINKEIQNAKEGKEAYIYAKMNSLVDDEMISKLYHAAQNGVKIKLIIRGICCLVPGQKHQSENIEVVSLVDKYLEHSRIFIFCNGGHEKYYLASADWMSRNLDHRSEVAVPIYDIRYQKQLKDFVLYQLSDTAKLRIIDKKQDNKYKQPESGSKYRFQEEFPKSLLKS